MDFLRKCYVTRVRPFAGSSRTAVVRWYWAPEGAPVLPGFIWRSSAWYVQGIDGQYPPPPPIGEERSVPFRWSPGNVGRDLAVAKCTVGDPAWFSTGIPPAALVPNPPPTPACCRISPALARGGLWLGGLGKLRGAVIGGLRLGGRALRPAVPIHFGGLRLGGLSVVTPQPVAVGGLLVGGEALAELVGVEGGLRLGGLSVVTPQPVAVGGLLVGGEALAELVGVEGGLRLGGVQETEPIPVGVGGFRIGGEAQEPMALLYCSLRITNIVNFPPSTRVTMPWNTVEEDPSGMYSSGTPTRITVPENGVYAVQHQFLWPLVSSAYNITGELLVNGTLKQILYSGGVSASYSASFGGTALLHLAAGDYLEIDGVQSSGFIVNPPTIGEDAPCFRVAGLGSIEPPRYVKSTITNANVTTTSGSDVEMSTSLRVTIEVPLSGKVLVRQSAVISASAAPADCFLSVAVDSGAFTRIGAMDFQVANARGTVAGEVELTGITPGTRVFKMGWSQAGGVTLTCAAGSFGGAQIGTWMSIATTP